MSPRPNGNHQGAAEKERRALIRKWESTPSPNPEFKGATPKQVAQKLLRPFQPRRGGSRPR